jgi:hypothetical protein
MVSTTSECTKKANTKVLTPITNILISIHENVVMPMMHSLVNFKAEPNEM